VLVLREEDKAEARRFFRTPLVFAIHEAKGLEYESIVLFRFISDQRAAFAQLAAGVTAEDLTSNDLDYHRTRDKTDKSLEVYKFYVNALYVALTRAIQSVYLIESDTGHELLRLLGLAAALDAVRVNARASSREEWQKEAHRLELQGKQEQAEAVRATILKETPVPWPVFNEVRLRELIVKVFRDLAPGSKPRQQLFEYATAYDEPMLAVWLLEEAGFELARGFEPQRATLGRRHLNDFAGRHFKGILQNCDRHGVDHRTSMNYTP
jgi:ATP-dependent exoDNAse (exonuclease V) beta subunit